jgi:hypothetical protein
MSHSYDDAFYTIDDIKNAEVKSRGILGHSNIMDVLEQMEWAHIIQMPWFRLSESDRDIISSYCGIKPRFKELDIWQK